MPSGYQQVEYIQSSGTQYIDTGLKGKNAISIDTDYSITSATTWASLLGCANSTAGNSVACVFGITKSGSINGGWYWRNTTNEQFDSNNVAQLDLKTNLKASATSFVFKNTNGTKTYSFSEVNSFETTPNMYIFASNKNGTINDYSKIKLYYMKIFDGTTLKREYLPCYRISDNVIGLYDMVENKFYTNAGTGTFTKGEDIVDTINEEYFDEDDVAFKQKYGPINSIVLSRAVGSDNVFLRDEDSIAENGLTEIKIEDNQIMNFDDRSDFLLDILEKLDGLEYYPMDVKSKGILYYELCDRYKVEIGENAYTCVLFNDEITVEQAIEEHIYVDLPEKAETD